MLLPLFKTKSAKSPAAAASTEVAPSTPRPGRLVALRRIVTPSRMLPFVVVGATLGAFLDQCHTLGGVITHPNNEDPLLEDVKLFGFVYCFSSMLYALFTEVLFRVPRPPAPIEEGVAIFLGVYVPGYLMTAFAGSWLSNATQLGILLALSAFLWHRYDGSVQGVVALSIVAAVGAGIEATWSSCPRGPDSWLCPLGPEVFQYVDKDLLGRVPYWLPGIYTLSSTTLGQIARRYLARD